MTPDGVRILPNGRPAKLTAEQAAQIRSRRAGGERVKDLARAFGVSDILIYQILNGKAAAYA